MELIISLIGIAIGYIVLYFVIKGAVRNAIIEARHISEAGSAYSTGEESGIAQVVCPNCGKKHDMDYPKCPYCKHQY